MTLLLNLRASREPPASTFANTADRPSRSSLTCCPNVAVTRIPFSFGDRHGDSFRRYEQVPFWTTLDDSPVGSPTSVAPVLSKDVSGKRTHNPLVAGSSPARPTITRAKMRFKIDSAKLC